MKQEARDEQERHLHAKIVLQRELIHAQDEYIQKKQREREMDTAKVRDNTSQGHYFDILDGMLVT